MVVLEAMQATADVRQSLQNCKDNNYNSIVINLVLDDHAAAMVSVGSQANGRETHPDIE